MSFCKLRHFRNILKQNIICLKKQTKPLVLEHVAVGFNLNTVRSFSTSYNLFVKRGKNHDFDKYDTDVELDDDQISEELAKLEQSLKEHGSGGMKKRKSVYRYQSDGALHVPVMMEEVLEHLAGKENQTILDMTFGAGGHTKSLLDAVPGCHILALDRDPTAHQLSCELALERSGQITPLLGRFSELSHLLSAHNIQPNTIDGALFDLGSSSMQFDQSERGFSLSKNGPLDMRMDGGRYPDQPTAADIVNILDELDIAKILKKYGDEKRAYSIAHAIIEARSAFGKITTTHQLADIIEGVCEGAYGFDKLNRRTHPATKTFQALRIFVNNEMNELNSGLELVHKYMKLGGICMAISFHSLEDRIVKRHFNTIDLDAENCLSYTQKSKLKSSLTMYSKEQLEQLTVRKWERVSKKIIVPSEEEVMRNPRSRSARLRAAVKIN